MVISMTRSHGVAVGSAERRGKNSESIFSSAPFHYLDEYQGKSGFAVM